MAADDLTVPIGQILTEEEWQAIRDQVVAAVAPPPGEPFTNVPPDPPPTIEPV